MTHPGHPVGTVCVIVGPLSSPRLGCRVRISGPPSYRKWEWVGGTPIPLPVQEIAHIDYTGPGAGGRCFWSAPLLRPLDGDTDASDDEVVDHYTLGKLREPEKAA